MPLAASRDEAQPSSSTSNRTSSPITSPSILPEPASPDTLSDPTNVRSSPPGQGSFKQTSAPPTPIESFPVAAASVVLEGQFHSPLPEGLPLITLEPVSPKTSSDPTKFGSSPPGQTSSEMTSTTPTGHESSPAATPSLVLGRKRSRRDARFSGDLEIDERKYRMTYYRGVADFKQYSVFSLPVRFHFHLPS